MGFSYPESARALPASFPSATSPMRGGFRAGFAREKGAPQSGELAEPARPEGLCSLSYVTYLPLSALDKSPFLQ